MPKVICTLPNASTHINGVHFALTEDKMAIVSEEISEEAAALFLSIPGYEEVPADDESMEKEAAAAEAAAKTAAAKASALKAATARRQADKDAADKKAADKKPAKKTADPAPAPVEAVSDKSAVQEPAAEADSKPAATDDDTIF